MASVDELKRAKQALELRAAKARADKAEAEAQRAKARSVSPAVKISNPSKKGKWSPALGERICVALEEGISLHKAAKREGVTESAVRKWSREKKDFGARYALARSRQPDIFHDDIERALEEADEAALDPINASARLAALRLRIDTRKWQLAKLHPEKYGANSRVELHTTGSSGGGITLACAGDSLEAVLDKVAQRQAKFAALAAKEQEEQDAEE